MTTPDPWPTVAARLEAFEKRVDGGFVNALRKTYDPGATAGSDGFERAVDALKNDLRTALSLIAEMRADLSPASPEEGDHAE